MTCWQHNLQTFYNPNPGREELAEFAFLLLLERYNKPKTFKGAWDHQDLTERENWRSAIRKEFNNMLKRGVWKRLNKKDLPNGRKLISNKWVFKKKNNGIYRARLVALGYNQVPGVDFTKNYATVVNDITMHMMVVFMKLHRWKGKIINVET